MLLELSIRNLAIIDAVSITFSPGLNVMTGETGAGKSIVVDAVNLILGERADRDMIQAGAEKATVEAVFDISGNDAIQPILESLGLEAEDGTLLIVRELTVAGRTTCRVGGSLVPLSSVKQIAETLLDMHGQHEHQSLLDVRKHLHYLDAYGDARHQSCLGRVREAYQAWYVVTRELTQLRERLTLRESRMDLLRFQLSEIDAAHLRIGEEEELERQRMFYRNAEKITEGIETAFLSLYQGEGNQASALDALRSAIDSLAPLTKLDASYESLHNRLEELYFQMEDASIELRAMRDHLEYDPENAEAVEIRLDIISRLRRKYGLTAADILSAGERIAQELRELEDAEESEAVLARRCGELEKELYTLSGALHASRKELATKFEAQMKRQLFDLGMQHAALHVQLTSFPNELSAREQYGAFGVDHAEFLLAPNPGEPERPLARIASGGELSRIMLALKSISAEKTGVPSMVFDEIDTGISGRMAQVVAEKMASLAKRHQIICVTHLPQISAMGDAQFLIQKQVQNGKTRTCVELLDEAGRCAELARIVGGADANSKSSLKHAATLLREARERKVALRERV